MPLKTVRAWDKVLKAQAEPPVLLISTAGTQTKDEAGMTTTATPQHTGLKFPAGLVIHVDIQDLIATGPSGHLPALSALQR